MATSTILNTDPAGRQKRVLRVNNVCRRLDLPDRTVRWLAERGRIRAHKIDGKSWGFLPEDVEAYRVRKNNGR